MNSFMSGANMVLYVVASLFFVRFWRRTKDALFLSFAVAFGLMAVEKVAVEGLRSHDETAPYLYLLRLLSFLAIISAIVRKNRAHQG